MNMNKYDLAFIWQLKPMITIRNWSHCTGKNTGSQGNNVIITEK